MAKKRASATAAAESSRPSKKRKSAEASKAKIKEIAEAEEVAEAEELTEMKIKAKIEVKDDEEAEEVQTVVAPGFRVWNTTSKMTAGGELSEASMLDVTTQKHSMVLDIQSDEAFTLKPLVITQGPYKGFRVFMLESGAKFRFFDFPAEIRNLVYSFLVEEDEPIKMDTHKVVNDPRRPVRATYLNVDKHRGLKRNHKTGKWIDQPASNLTVLRASKKVYQEVAPLLYGNNRFVFDDLSDLKVFLDRVGSVRQYLRHISVNQRGWSISKANSVFSSLKDATDLRTLSFHHEALYTPPNEPAYWSYRYYMDAERLAGESRSLMKVLHNEHKDVDDGFSVLDIFKVHWERCHNCKPLAPEFAPDGECRGSHPGLKRCIKCKDGDEHCNKLQMRIRKKLAGLLNIEE